MLRFRRMARRLGAQLEPTQVVIEIPHPSGVGHAAAEALGAAHG